MIHYIGNETAWDNIAKGNDWKPDSCLVHCVLNTTTKKATLDANGYFEYICNEEGCNEWSYGRTGISKPAGFTLSKTSYTYDGTKKKPAVTVKDSDGKMIDRSNYDVAYSNNVNAGKAIAIVTFKGDRYEGSKRLTFTINKAANPLKMKPKPATVKFRKLKIKDQYLTVGKVITFKNKGQGTRSYKLVSAKKDKQDFKKKFTVNSKTGKVTAKKGLKKGKYKVKIKVTAAGNDNYKKVTKPVTVTIKVE